MRRIVAAALAMLTASTWSLAGAGAGVLEQVRSRGYVACGVTDGSPGFSTMSNGGTWRGLEVEFCQALAAAVIGGKGVAKLVPISAGDRFAALRRGDIDVLARGTAWTLDREGEAGARFTAVLFYDGQGFLVRRSEAITSALELSGATVCLLSSSQERQAIVDFFGRHRMRYELIASEGLEPLIKAYQARNCLALSADVSALAVARSRMPASSSHAILPELISKEPVGPYVRQGDDQWFSIVRWTVMALIEAEELSITAANAEQMRATGSPAARRLLGSDGNLGAALGLAPDWAFQAIRQVGNYGEMYERNLGLRSPLKLPRGLNGLWSKGGLMYAAPFR